MNNHQIFRNAKKLYIDNIYYEDEEYLCMLLIDKVIDCVVNVSGKLYRECSWSPYLHITVSTNTAESAQSRPPAQVQPLVFRLLPFSCCHQSMEQTHSEHHEVCGYIQSVLRC